MISALRGWLLPSLVVALSIPLAAQSSDKGSRATPPCGSFRAELRSEIAALRAPAATAAASRSSGAAASIPLEKAVKVTLTRQSQVEFGVGGSAARGGPTDWAGVLSLNELPAGMWRVSADGPMRLDIVANGALLDSPTFEMDGNCPGLHKTVVFKQTSAAPAVLLISGARAETVSVIVTPAAPK